MGQADFMQPGGWNARCARCGKKRKGSDLVKQWQGYWVCPEHWEPRHPQDFVKSVQEDLSPPFVQNPEDRQIFYCTPNGSSAIADFAVADCAIADYIHPAFDPEVTPAIP